MSGRQTGAWLAVWRIAAGTKRSEAAAAPGRQTDVQCELPGRLLKATERPSPPSGGQSCHWSRQAGCGRLPSWLSPDAVDDHLQGVLYFI